ncbi:MAG: hypothetical protein H0Z40_01360 [Desulfotomaculum sp.]|nr:hypothetical protein [Desulfotomaculum sp.]
MANVQNVLEYCQQNSAKLDRMTTSEISRHLKEQFPDTPVMVIVDALATWCTEHRPKIAG